MRFTSLLLVITSSLLLSACVTSYQGDADAKDPDGNERTMHLYRIDVDQAAHKAGAPLLFAEPPPRTQFGFQRRAQGFFSVSDAGFCRIEVRCAEPIVALDGRRTEQVYTLLKFAGRSSDDGARATTMSGESVNVYPTAGASEVRFMERGRNKISIQAYDRGRKAAYVFHFHHTTIGRKDIPVPWR